MNPFQDQANFMEACGQSVGKCNPDQFLLYKRLIGEEVDELFEAIDAIDRTEIFDALLDIIVVCIGAGHSMGFPMEAGWRAVVESNLRKVDPETGKVMRRDDGKILKPEGWKPPTEKLARLIGVQP